MDLKIILNKEEMLKLCEKDKDFEVCIQRAALNYIRNSKLKPLLKEEIVREIEQYKKDLASHVKQVLKDLGATEGDNWSSKYASLSDTLKKRLAEEVKTIMSEFITTTVRAELTTAHAHIKKETEVWEKAIERMCKENLTEAKLKVIAKEVLEKRLATL